MDIELKTDIMLSSIKSISHREVGEIADPEARYRAEAGTEKETLIKSCICDGAAKLTHRLARFLSSGYTRSISNEPEWKEQFVYSLDLSERRMANKAEPIMSEMQNFIIHYALAKFYSTVSQSDLSNKHSLITNDAAINLDNLIYTKLPPR